MKSLPFNQLLRFARSRFYGATGSSAASSQPLLDYDYYRNRVGIEPLGDQLALCPMADSEGSVSMRGVHWVFIGSPGAKKRMYVEKLAKLLEVPYISIATLVRQDLNPRSSLYRQIANAVNSGELVSEDIIFGLLSKRLEDGHYIGESGFILDGIPRSQIQAEILDQLIEIDLVVNFKYAEDCLRKYNRGIVLFLFRCQESHDPSNCQPTKYQFLTSIELIQHIVLPNTDGVWKEKIRVFMEENNKLEDFYRKQNKLLDFEVGNAPGETWKELLATLHLQHLYAARSQTHKRSAEFT